MGDVNGLADDVIERRQTSHQAFVKGGDVDPAYLRFDIPLIAYRYQNILDDGITINKKFIREGIVQRRTFHPSHLKKIEHVMRLMLAAGNVAVRLTWESGELSVVSSSKHRRGTFVEHGLSVVPRNERPRATPNPSIASSSDGEKSTPNSNRSV